MIFTLNLRTLRPLRLCGRYSEFRLRLCRAGAFVVEKHFLKCRFSFAKFLYNRRPYVVARPRNRLFKLNHERKF